MLEIIVLILLALTVFGYIQVSVPGLAFLKSVLLVINGRAITLLNIIVFSMVLWALGVLPSPFREIAIGLLLLWLLSIFGIIAIVWSGHFILIAIIVLLFVAILTGK